MAENLDILNTAVSLLIRAALLAARFSGRVRQRYLKRLAAKGTDAKAQEILFLKDRVYQLEMWVSLLQKHLGKKGKSPRYTVRERLLTCRACSDAGFGDNQPLAQCKLNISGLDTFTCVMVDSLPFLWLSTIRYLLMLRVLFWPGG
jgi:hypothetical protein